MPNKLLKRIRCAVYARKSSNEGLEQDFNSLDAQREACEAYIASQTHEGWVCLPDRYDDGGISGATLDRSAMQQLLADIKDHKIDVVVVYKVDRLTRALADFAKIVEIFDAQKVSFVSVTQQFNTTTSMGRLTLNVLLSFAQFEREVTAERIRDKIAASKKKGMWMGGSVPLGYDVKDRKLVINETEAETIKALYRLYLEKGNVREATNEANRRGYRTKLRVDLESQMRGGRSFSRGHMYRILSNPIYVGRVPHKQKSYPGLHTGIIDQQTWDAVHRMMEGNGVQRRRSKNAKHPSLLAGKLFDERGMPFTPSHAVKKGRHYHYYIERSAIQQAASEHGAAPRRIPALEIENLVINAIHKLLMTPHELLDSLPSPNRHAAETRAILANAKELKKKLQSHRNVDAHALVHSLIKRVILTSESLRITFSNTALWETLGANEPVNEQNDPDLSLEVAARLRPRGNELKFVVMDASNRGNPKFDQPLFRAVIRAHTWLNELMTGEARRIRDIARREDINERFVRRTLDLAFLAPDIVQAILDGHQPEDLRLQELMVGRMLPSDWATQRRLLRFF